MPEIEHILHSSVFNYDTMGQMTFHHTHRVRTTYTREMCHTDEWKVTNSNKSSNRLPFHRITNVTIFRYQNMSFIKNNNNTRDGMAFVIVIKLMHTLFIHFTPQQRRQCIDDDEMTSKFRLIDDGEQTTSHSVLLIPKFCWNASIISVC